MYTITARNVNEALSTALRYMDQCGVVETSRNGAVLVAPEPVTTTYLQPMERVLFSDSRNANPFFHMMEALWMLAGRNDLSWPLYFNSRFGAFSDDGVSINGAYGQRWRSRFGSDQLKSLVDLLSREPDTRRAVLGMWSPEVDLLSNSKDIPCNTHVYFDLRGGALNMTVCCRSNDLWWGAYGANVVHFSVLQEYLAHWLRVRIGEYRQLSNNFHLYLDIVPREKLVALAVDATAQNYYTNGLANEGGVYPESIRTLGVPMELWDQDLANFFSDPCGDTNYEHRFFNAVAAPMYAAWKDRKDGTSSGRSSAAAISARDWREACLNWIARAEKRKEISNG